MTTSLSDDDYCKHLICVFADVFPDLEIHGGADEPFYEAATLDTNAKIYFRDNYPRSLLHEMSHYCLAGEKRRKIDDFGYWYEPCGRDALEQQNFEKVEARPQGLEKAMCAIIDLKFSPSLDDFSGRPPSDYFLQQLDSAYREMSETPPPTAKEALQGLINHRHKFVLPPEACV